MAEFALRVDNKLITQKRDINVYLHSTRSSHIISHTSSVTLPLRTTEAGDYLHLSVVSGPGNLEKDCVIDMPAWLDFQFFSQGNVTVTHKKDRTLLEIPPGPPVWQLKMSRPSGQSDTPGESYISIKENNSM